MSTYLHQGGDIDLGGMEESFEAYMDERFPYSPGLLDLFSVDDAFMRHGIVEAAAEIVKLDLGSDSGKPPNEEEGNIRSLDSISPRNKRFPCAFVGCPYRGYSKRDADRHFNARHREGAEKAQFYCTHTGCPRARRAFTRKDQRDRHLRCVHDKKFESDFTPAISFSSEESAASSAQEPISEEASQPRPESLDDLSAELRCERMLRVKVETKLKRLRSSVLLVLGDVACDELEQLRSRLLIALATVDDEKA